MALASSPSHPTRLIIGMKQRHLLIALLASLALSAQAAESFYFKFSELVKSKEVQKFLSPEVKLYWADQPTPSFPEVARPDVYTRSSISHTLLGGSKAHCIEAFEMALESMLGEARSHGYDAVINVRAARGRKPSEDPSGFSCTPGFRSTEGSLWGSFAMSEAAVQRAAEADRKSANLPGRPPAKGAILLPLDSILASPEAQAVLGTGIKIYLGIKAPEYSERDGPDDYSEEVELAKLSPEEACRQAVIKSLATMVRTAQEKGFDSIIRIRSFLDEQYVPGLTDVECQLSKKEAAVTLQASLANQKERAPAGTAAGK